VSRSSAPQTIIQPVAVEDGQQVKRLIIGFCLAQML